MRIHTNTATRSGPWNACRLLVTLLALGPAPWTAAQEAAPAAPDGNLPAADAPPTTDTAAAARATYQRLLEEKRYEEATTIAGQIVALTSRAYGERSIEMAEPLADLAAAQLRGGDLAGAEANYKASIDVIEGAEGIGSPRLVAPLTGLGDTYHEVGLHLQAAETYERALRTNHAAAGFYNLEQAPILDGLSESYLALDRLPQANAQQRYQVMVQRRRSGADSAQMVPSLYKLARWYNRTGQYNESREAYEAALRVIRASGGENDPAMVDALTGQAVTYLNEGNVPASAGLLKRALALLDAQPSRDHLKRAEVLVNLGDLYTLTRQPRSARQRYVQAWEELTGEEPLLSRRQQYFGEPSRIAGPRLPAFVGAEGTERASPRATGESFAAGHVLASLTVDAGGAARDAVILESDPPGLLDQQLLRTLQATAFRPRMQDGDTVPSDGIQYRHDFRYLRSPAGGSRSAAGPATSDDDKRISYPGEDTGTDDESGR